MLDCRVHRSCDVETLKLSSDVNSGIKKCKRDYGGVWRSLHLVGDWCQAVSFMLVHLAQIWLQLP
jgi:hypothetical protein